MTDLSHWLTKPDAAARLGISERTLERLCTRGEGPELRTRPRPGRKPEAVCNPDDVERLAAAKPHVMPATATEQRIREFVGLAPMPSPESSVSLSSVLLVVDRIAGAVESRLAEPAPAPPALYLTLKEAARYSGLSVALLKRLILHGQLSSIRDRAVKVKRSDLDSITTRAVIDANLSELSESTTTSRIPAGNAEA